MALETGFDNGLHHRWIIEFLRVVDFVAARNTAGVIMGDIGAAASMIFLFVTFDCADHVTFHDLHVINIVEQFESLGTDPFAQLNPQAVWSHI